MKYGTRNILIIFCIVILTVYILSSSVFAAIPTPDNDQTIRVFFPLQEGFAEVDKEGNYSGYTYDYLMAIAQLTGWKYEFFPVDLTKENFREGLNKIKRGELDLAGTMNYNEDIAEDYEYSIPYGNTNYTLVAGADNIDLNSRTLVGYKDLKAAIIKSSVEQNTLLDKFCQENSIEYQPVYAKDSNECRKLVAEGLADITISKDISQNNKFKIVAKLASSQLYFVATKGETELVQRLNNAMRSIDVAYPTFSLMMHEKYFPADLGIGLPLTMDEVEYIKNAPAIRVAVPGERAPIQFYDENTGEFGGILIDIMEIISERSGLRFEFYNSSDEQLLRQSINDGDYDVVSGISYFNSHNAASGTVSTLLLTPPIFSSPVIRISSLRGNIKNEEVIVARSIKMFEGRDEIVYRESIEEIFELVDQGEYGEAYVNGYMAQHVIETGSYPNVSLSFTPYGNYGLCLGVSRKSDLRLVSILSQAIATLSPTEIEEIVYANTNHEMDNRIWTVIRRDPSQIAAPALVILMIIFGLLLLLFAKTKRLNKFMSNEKNKYKAISQIDRLSKTYNNIEFKHLATNYFEQKGVELSGAIIVCDIDDFKNINDTFGHLKGDEVISTLGSLMATIFRGDDIVGRLGGDEFVVLLKNVASVEVVERRCIELIENSRNIISEQIITLSIGAAVFNSGGKFDEIFGLADRALYDVKNSGKDSYKICVHNSSK